MKQIALDIGMSRGPTLASFCAGPNDAALAHLKLWAGNPTRSPVPTYLWGDAGSGKTHLLKAVPEALREQGAVVGWLDAGMQEPPSFSESWTAVLLDDVHLFTAVQQHAAFNWFVHAQTLQRAVLAAGDQPPAALRLRDDLRTRLGWGVVRELLPLADDEKPAALLAHARQRGFGLSADVIGYLLAHGRRDMPALVATLATLDRQSLANKRAITIPMLKEWLNRELRMPP